MAVGKIVIKASLCALLAAGTLTASAEEAGKVDADTLAQMEALARQLAEDSLSQRDKGARAIVNGNLLLRDAKYRYHELATEAGNPLIFMSHDCDVYQIVMTVNRGAATLVVGEFNRESEMQDALRIYPDKLGPGAGMFAYTLYSNSAYKVFAIKNGDFERDTQSAEVTAFGYCFSTKTSAQTVFTDRNGVAH